MKGKEDMLACASDGLSVSVAAMFAEARVASAKASDKQAPNPRRTGHNLPKEDTIRVTDFGWYVNWSGWASGEVLLEHFVNEVWDTLNTANQSLPKAVERRGELLPAEESGEGVGVVSE